MCPKGDDPVTENQNYREFSLDVYGTLTGKIGLKFMGVTSYISLASPSSTNCYTGLQSTGVFGSFSCVYSDVSSSHYKFTITIYAWPTMPKENNLHSHDGNPPITDFYCDISQTSADVYCLFNDIQNYNIRGTFKIHNNVACISPLLERSLAD